MSHSKVADRYAGSLIEIATEEKNLAEVEADFQLVRITIDSSRDLQNLLATPIVDARRKEAILEEIFSGKVSAVVGRFIGLLARKGRAEHLRDTIEAFNRLLDESRNIAPATITTAVALDRDQRAQIERHLGELSGRTLRPEYLVDPSLVGGFQAMFEDRMVDASVRHQLDRLRDVLTVGRN